MGLLPRLRGYTVLVQCLIGTYCFYAISALEIGVGHSFEVSFEVALTSLIIQHCFQSHYGNVIHITVSLVSNVLSIGVMRTRIQYRPYSCVA